MASALSLALIALVVLACFASSAEAYRKRKGHDYHTPYWTRPTEEDLKIDVQGCCRVVGFFRSLRRLQFKPKDCSRKAGLGDVVKVHYTVRCRPRALLLL